MGRRLGSAEGYSLMTARCIRQLLHLKSHHTETKSKRPRPRTYDQKAKKRASITVPTLLCPSVCCTNSSSPALMRSNRLALPTTHPIPWNTAFSRVLLFISSPWSCRRCLCVPCPLG